MTDVRTVAVIGAGVIGAGWAARCLASGLDVVAWDPGEDWQAKLRASVDNAWPALTEVGLHPGASRERLRCADSLESACVDADFIQEAAPERIDLKIRLHAQMDAASRPGTIIASSTSGLLPSEFQSQCGYPERVLVGHPFNPVYLLPLVEVLGGEKTSQAHVDAAADFYAAIGMHPLKVRAEVPGFLSDRLQEALWREVLHLVNDGVATTEELDAAIAYGPGLRWAIWGSCLTYHLAGGEGGMRHFLDHFDPAEFPWTKLEAPPLTAELIDRMASGCEAQSAGRSIKEMEQLRDNCLIGVMRALRRYRVGAGENLYRNEERKLQPQTVRWQPGDEASAPLALYTCTVLPEWEDYNAHMNEAAYVTAFGWSTDALFHLVGVDESYRKTGNSFYTVETHISYLHQAATGDPLRFTTQLLGVDDKRLHIFHSMYHGDSGELLATSEQMLLHVDSQAAKASVIPAQIREPLDAIMHQHQDLPGPATAGHAVGMR